MTTTEAITAIKKYSIEYNNQPMSDVEAEFAISQLIADSGKELAELTPEDVDGWFASYQDELVEAETKHLEQFSQVLDITLRPRQS